MADITGVEEGVGLTALMVAAARAIETHRRDTLAQDVYAEHFVRAARASADWPVRPQQVPDGEVDPLWGRLGRYFGLRTRVFDDFVLRRVDAGARQVVLFGAGLDTRAYRLDWPPGRRVFELDQEGVLAFKDRVLGELGAAPKTERVTVAADLRDDWTGALTGAGFDPAVATAWIAEGLLLYLPPAAERSLIGTVDALSPHGSALAYEVKLGPESTAVRESPIYSVAKRTGIDLLAMFDLEPRPDSAADLATRGWDVSVHTAFDFTRRYGRGPLPEPDRPDALAVNRWTFATRP
ncbi:class I SAM-dependent methyltransferase [Actinoallomurus spadix]|uniref:S-adenosyl-L-methionine-dependent methyltransferase n=1 Tax=Actinoallomurus spadix TaxID=79912 RepID=A0ABP3H7N6_9ACTN|nr:class I SAM-dependent methyltransferase [Actinoallomurus spadix]MCO5988920.1 class I SAM-dependent methyltransferase [Actinoallomurus spadix]